MLKKVIIVGAFHEIIELCEDSGYDIVGLIDNTLMGSYYDYKVIGCDNDVVRIYNQFSSIPLVITPDSPMVRAKLYSLYSGIGFKFETVISKRARISKSAVIGEGTIIQDFVNVSANTIIGDFVKLNTGSNVMHDCKVNDFTTIAPNATVLGRVALGQSSYVGANSTILPELNIGDNVIIGAGAVVTNNIDSNKTVKGIPAK